MFYIPIWYFSSLLLLFDEWIYIRTRTFDMRTILRFVYKKLYLVSLKLNSISEVVYILMDFIHKYFTWLRLFNRNQFQKNLHGKWTAECMPSVCKVYFFFQIDSSDYLRSQRSQHRNNNANSCWHFRPIEIHMEWKREKKK